MNTSGTEFVLDLADTIIYRINS